ncbi:N-acetylhexosaminidase [Rickenella mellea]|uniref:Beta-hexosaminidase n=1 Tax=Rickenella mellea TaxID=50990 RepID=A0A4Y7PWC9_9AGAM|nr:N-acetylhexosaminidase [Rickenella mellea]
MWSLPIILIVLLSQAFSVDAHSIWPLPRKVSNGTTVIILDDYFDITYDFFDVPVDLKLAVDRTKRYLAWDQLSRLVVDRGLSDKIENFDKPETPRLFELRLELTNSDSRSICDEAIADWESRDESYTLLIPADNSAAILSAKTTLGLFRGLTTFTQLFYTFEEVLYTPYAPLTVEDAPAYPYRGFMLDTARNYFPVADIKRLLEAMSWVKLNTFHWHVVDSQSFPLEVPGFMELSHHGAYRGHDGKKLKYTVENVDDIVSFAAARGIDVLVEIDMPGHTSVVSKAYKEHVECAEGCRWSELASEPPSGQLRYASANTTKWASNLVESVGSMFPSKYMSTGGDEVNANCTANDKISQAALRMSGKSAEQALNVFMTEVQGAVKRVGKTPVVWDDMLLDKTRNVQLTNDTIVMVWHNEDAAVKVVEKGFKIIHANYDYFYLDCGHGPWVVPTSTYTSWCDPFKSWQKAYSFDPLANITRKEKDLVLGGEHLLWTEQASPHNLDSIAWPRAAASAEVFWTGAKTSSGKPLDVRSALPRLHQMTYRMQKRGIRATPLQPMWCALRPGRCNSMG